VPVPNDGWSAVPHLCITFNSTCKIGRFLIVRNRRAAEISSSSVFYVVFCSDPATSNKLSGKIDVQGSAAYVTRVCSFRSPFKNRVLKDASIESRQSESFR